MTINAQTKIATLLKQHPAALEAIVSISPKFSKLRNPVLRKVIAGRTSISMAAAMGGCSVDDFFKALKPIGFEMDITTALQQPVPEERPVPEFFKNLQAGNTVELDVRPVIESGKDPLTIILQNVKKLETGFVLKLINSFEPVPLIQLLGKQGFESYTEKINAALVNTYFYKPATAALSPGIEKAGSADGWEELIHRYAGNMETADVRNLEMPGPMHVILDALEKLPGNKALFVYHKRIPVFLLPELDAQQFSYRIKEVSDAEVQLIIYKD